MNKLYCAGTFCFDFLDSNYREMAKKDYRSLVLGDSALLLQKSDYVLLNKKLKYIGPFYFESEGMVDELIVSYEVGMIRECTHAIFLLDEGCCPGTIAELILASELKKNVQIFYIRRGDSEETESKLHTPCWFPIIMSQQINHNNTKVVECKNYEEAIENILSYVRSL